MLDELDRRLLALLRHNARESVVVLARKLKVSRGTVQNRIARMLAEQRILGFTVRTAGVGEDRVRAVMSIAIEGEQTGKVVKALKGFAEVESLFTTNGRWDLVATLNTANLAEFSRALDAIRLIAGIDATETSLLLAPVK
jgi:DNA-binding Lrp family transcriptional regulator